MKKRMLSMGAFLCTIAIAIANVAYQDDTVRFTEIADGKEKIPQANRIAVMMSE